ncbi:MAG: flagellar basal-body MS-ring/collar protein FliF [Gemmatimonadota bacterium]
MSVFLQQLTRSLDRLGVGRRVQVGLAAALAVALVWGVYRWSTAPTWVPVLGALDLQTVPTVTGRLDEEGILYRMEKGGSEIHVASTDLARARIVLAEQGVVPSGRTGFEIFDQPSWGMTDFTQRINYKRALEGELERTIAEMAGVDGAKVHLSMGESSVFRRANEPAEASVVLTLRPGFDAGDGMVRGITYLVASSVDRLSSEHVTVLDAQGRMLSASTESDTGIGLTSRQLETQLAVERHLESKARRLLDPLVGPGNADVRVAATLNFDQVARTVQSVDPEAQVLLSEERAEVIPGEGATGAASQQSKTTFDGTRSVEQFTQGQGGVERLTVAVLVNAAMSTDEEGNVSFTDRTADELARIEALVRNAVGVDGTRGDAISVVSVPFSGVTPIVAPEPSGTGILDWIQMLQKPVLAVLALILAFILSLRALRTLRETPRAQPPVLVAGDGADRLPEPARAPLPASRRPQREELAARVVENPQAAARVVNSWLQGA